MWLLVSYFNVLPKSLPFCFVVPLSSFQNQLVIFYSTLMGVFEGLLGPSSLECPKAPLIH
jgi:hypothetical protein